MSLLHALAVDSSEEELRNLSLHCSPSSGELTSEVVRGTLGCTELIC